jgi:hypothetical protein
MDRTLVLSLGLFGAPAAQAHRDREAREAEKRKFRPPNGCDSDR